MKGDFTRFTFDPKKHYSSVLMQQGRVVLDADWNEQADIQGNIRETGVADIVGRQGTPIDSAGFKVELAPEGEDLILSSGQMYVDGILCELDCDQKYFGQVTFPFEDRVRLTAPDADCICLKKEQWIELSVEGDLQPQVLKIKEIDTANLILTFYTGINSDLMEAARIRGIYIKILFKIDDDMVANDRNYLVYLDLWKRHITAVEDDHIREKALNGLDTTTRIKTEWRPKLISYDDENISCRDASLKLKDLTDPGDSRLAVRLKTVQKESAKDLCAVISGSAYQGLENQLYRVEVHKPGKTGIATFKWSRNNGAIALAIEKKSIESETTDTITDQSKVTVQRLGWDQEFRVKVGDLVEVLDDETELKGEHGTLCKVLEIDEAKMQLTLSTELGEHKPEWHPKLLCWDCNPEQSKELPDQQDFDGFSAKDDWIELENGIEIRFKADDMYQTGDYWLIPARNTGTIEWSYKENDFIPRFGIQHHNCLLAIANLNRDGKWNLEKDCRKSFQPLADMVILSYVGGDGQEAMPGNDLPESLSLRVFRGGLPLEDAKVQFSVLKGNGQISGSSEKIYEAGPITVTTGEDGIARCLWKFGTDQPEDNLIWNEQVQAVLLYPEQEHPQSILFNASALAASLSYIGGDGQEAMPGQELPAHIQVRVLSSGYPVKSAKVKFEIFKGNGQIRENSEKIYEAGPITVTTGEDGIARCLWKFGTDQPENSLIWNEQVQAVLLYPEQEHPSSILFNANALATTLSYLGGDGQEAMPGDWLPAPFEVRVSRGERPVVGAKIAFEIIVGQGILDPAGGSVQTGKDGIARCRCRFNDQMASPNFRARAMLIDVVTPDENGEPSHPSIIFNANASVAEQVAYVPPKECIQLGGAETVRDAINGLCRQVSFSCAGGDGQEAIPGNELPGPFRVRVARGSYPIKDALVKFEIDSEKGMLKGEDENGIERIGTNLNIRVGPDGIATCYCTLNEKLRDNARIEAKLIKPAPAEDQGSIWFNANASVAEKVYYSSPEECSQLGDIKTVKDAINGLCRQVSFSCAGGDGQEAMPRDWLPAPFEVRVSRGEHPVEGAKIAFEISEGQGVLDPDPTAGSVTTGKDGIARCKGRFKSKDELKGGELESSYLRVTATLLDVVYTDKNGKTSHPSIIFNANASVAEKVAYDSASCPKLKDARTVQAAIDSLCKTLSGRKSYEVWVHGNSLQVEVDEGKIEVKRENDGAQVDVIKGAKAKIHFSIPATRALDGSVLTAQMALIRFKVESKVEIKNPKISVSIYDGEKQIFPYEIPDVINAFKDWNKVSIGPIGKPILYGLGISIELAGIDGIKLFISAAGCSFSSE